jgi:hypothetical protein
MSTLAPYSSNSRTTSAWPPNNNKIILLNGVWIYGKLEEAKAEI